MQCVCGVAAYASPVNPISIASAMARTTPAVATSVAAAEARPISMPAREGDAARCEEMHRGRRCREIQDREDAEMELGIRADER